MSNKNAVRNYAVIILLLFYVTACSAAAPDSNESVQLKYPIVLVHGIGAQDRDSLLASWSEIPELLRHYGAEVFFGNTDAWGSYESNAAILKNTIEKILEETGHERVNIIAHSKGGIDSRYLIWRHDFGGRVASLTTISTPHHGAELADLIADQDVIYTSIGRQAVEMFGQLYGDQNPDLFTVLHGLTTENMRKFNEKVYKDDRVFYQSLFTVMNRGLDDLTFYYTFLYIKGVAGPNDGVVSEWSASWGYNPRKIAEGFSHRQIINSGTQNAAGINVSSLYVELIRELAAKGF